MRRWQKDEALKDAAMIVHDLSELGIDAELLASDDAKPAAGQLDGRVAALHGKHSNQELHSSLGLALREIANLTPPPPLVLSESTGAARPWPLIKALTQNDQFTFRHFIVTVDALNLHRDFDDGRILAGASLASEDIALHHAAEVLAEQLAFASVIILTKTDTIPKEVVDAQVALLQQLQPKAAIGLSAQAGLQLAQLDGIPAPKLSELQQRAELFGLTERKATPDEVEAVIFKDPRPFHPQRLHEACQSELSTGLYRTKGFLWLASRPGHALLWQQSGSQISLELTGQWRAELVKNLDGKMLPEEIAHLEKTLKGADLTFGDRHNELTLIGLKPARDAFYKALENALCTDEEIEAWKNGASFTDPWPTKIRSVD